MNKIVINQLPVEKLHAKRVFVRIDVDSGETNSGIYLDDGKVRDCLPTLEYLLSVGARIIIGAHLGETIGFPVESMRLDGLAERLSELLGKPVRKLNDMVGRDVLQAVQEMKIGDILLLENLFFYPGELENDSEFAHELGRLADIYCCDAFALASRGYASTIGVTRYVRPAAAGLAMAREITMLESVLEKASHPFVAILGGARVDEKLPILENLLPKLDKIFIGGALAFTFLQAKGIDCGAAPVDTAFVPLAKKFLHKAEGKVEIVLPEDFIVMDAGEYGAYWKENEQLAAVQSRSVAAGEITPSDLPVDIGPLSVNRLKEMIASAHTVFWNGPLGVWQIEPFDAATKEVAEYLLDLDSWRYLNSVVCGDSLARALRSFDLPVERIRSLITSGEPALRMLAGNPLPAVSALDDISAVDLGTATAKRLRNILIPADGSEHSLEAVRQIGWLAGADRAEITLLYVSKPSSAANGEAWVDAKIKRVHAVEHQFEAERIFAAVNAELARHGLTARRQLMTEGDPADQILKFAEEISADLIAMGSHGRTGLLRLLMGSVSRKVSDCAKCPVLISRVPDAQILESGMTEAAAKGV